MDGETRHSTVPVIDLTPLLAGQALGARLGRARHRPGLRGHRVLHGHRPRRGSPPRRADGPRVARVFRPAAGRQKQRVARPRSRSRAAGTSAWVRRTSPTASGRPRPISRSSSPSDRSTCRPSPTHGGGRLSLVRAERVAGAARGARRRLRRVLPRDGGTGHRSHAGVRARARPARAASSPTRPIDTSAGSASSTIRISPWRHRPGSCRAGAHSDYGGAHHPQGRERARRAAGVELGRRLGRRPAAGRRLRGQHRRPR